MNKRVINSNPDFTKRPDSAAFAAAVSGQVDDILSALNRLQVVAAPATATSSGSAGMLAFDADYLYVCIATDTWKRVAIATF